MSSAAPLPAASPLVTRLAGLARLSADEVDALDAGRDQRAKPARRELMAEGQPVRSPRALLSGWACRQRIVADGRRQILSFLLPGDLIGVCRHSNPVAATAVLAVTPVVTCAAPDAEPGSGLAEAYARGAALEECYLLAQITRIGRYSAYERLADWLLETHDRLLLAGLAAADRFPLPLTQEMLADALGLTGVHVNRTLQAMRRDGLLDGRGGTVALTDRRRLERLVDYTPARVSAD